VGVPDRPDGPEDQGPARPEGARRPGAAGPGLPPLPDPDDVVVPDTIAELEAEIRAYHRELRAGRRGGGASRLRWRSPTRRWLRAGLSGPALVAALLVVALVGSMASVLVPRVPQRPTTQPLAAPSIPAARPGGLLPPVTVTRYDDEIPIRDRRPSVIVLVPPQCQQCSGILDGLFAQAKAEGLRFDLVGAPERVDELRSLDRATGNGGSDVLLDDGDELAAAYGEGVLTVLVVAPDGIVAEVLRDPARDASIQPTLARLYHRTTTAA
jgi:hypothetical protein